MKIVIVEHSGAYEYSEELARAFTKMDIPDTIFILVPKEAEVKIADTVDV